jgi:hypothetical protein
MTSGGRGGVAKDVETCRGESRPRRHPFFGHPPSPQTEARAWRVSGPASARLPSRTLLYVHARLSGFIDVDVFALEADGSINMTDVTQYIHEWLLSMNQLSS